MTNVAQAVYTDAAHSALEDLAMGINALEAGDLADGLELVRHAQRLLFTAAEVAYEEEASTTGGQVSAEGFSEFMERNTILAEGFPELVR
jgi:hypothetical protein